MTDTEIKVEESVEETPMVSSEVVEEAVAPTVETSETPVESASPEVVVSPEISA